MANRGAGQLKEKVAFDERAISSDGYGNEQGDFAEVLQCRAGFTYLRGSEAVIASRLEGKQPIVVRVRANSETEQIDHDWRMRDLKTGKQYAVQSVAPTEDRMFLDVLVTSGVAA